MVILAPEAETANNRSAESGVFGGRGNVNGLQVGDPEEGVDTTDANFWLGLTRQIKATAEQGLNPLRRIWTQNYRALKNEHVTTSKYNHEAFRGRSQLHRPKTRSAMKKANAGAANALFATSDIVAIEPINPQDPRSVASSAILKSLLNYRLDRKSNKAGVPWFQIAVGAHHDAKATGICVSKQYWEFREKDGKKLRDRPMIRLYPPELVLRDPGADWLDQAQESSYIGLMNAMTIGEVLAMVRTPASKTGGIQWRNVTEVDLTGARIGGDQAQVNGARESGGNAQREQLVTGIREFDRVWAIEWFVRYQDVDYCYWTAGSSALLSVPVPVSTVYPHMNGERPIVVGLGEIEPHKIDPMSMVQGIMPLQQEINDLANMRLDGVKETIRPLTFVKKGKNIDVRAIQRRSGDTAVYVTDEKDVWFDRPGSIGGEAYAEMNHLNSDFDDAVGQFNGASVSTNRSLNETVGGMKLLNGSANIVGDFDLRVWIETYVEPVLRQVVALEQYYEDDAVIISIAGQKAQLFQKHGISKVDDDLLQREMSVTVNAGIGSADPQIKQDKFIRAGAAVSQLLGPDVAARAKQDAIIDEIFGAAGIRDAAERFYHEGDQTDPRIKQMQAALQEMQAAVNDKQSQLASQEKIKKIDSATQIVKILIDARERAEAEQRRVMNTPPEMGPDGQPMAPVAPMPVEPAGPSTTSQALDHLLLHLVGDLFDKPIDQPAAPPPAAPSLPEPPPQAQPQQPDQMAGVMQAVMQMAQQMQAAVQTIASSIEALGRAQAMPKTAKRMEDGTIVVVPLESIPALPGTDAVSQSVNTYTQSQMAPRSITRLPDGSMSMN